MARDTGFPRADAQTDFGRARRQRALSRLSARLRREPDDVQLILPYEEVVEALGFESERSLGLQSIPLDSIVGTVDRSRDFDRSFRPTSQRVRTRWESVALAQRTGKAMPPIDVYRVGELHFVQDGHHRVSVARAHGDPAIDARVRQVQTARSAPPSARRKQRNGSIGFLDQTAGVAAKQARQATCDHRRPAHPWHDKSRTHVHQQ